jgi:mono/diheme cytochrome c family protein
MTSRAKGGLRLYPSQYVRPMQQQSQTAWKHGYQRGISLLARLGILTLCLVVVSGCATTMKVQPKYLPLAPSEFYPDNQSARSAPANTVARGLVGQDQLLTTGMQNGQPATQFPFPLTAGDLQRGQQLFNGICAPCHDRAGTGNGVVVQRGFSQPPAFHSDRLRSAPPGHFFDVITNGFGAMPAYGPIVQAPDRWRIIGYIRALQLSQDAKSSDVPADMQNQIQSGGQ